MKFLIDSMLPPSVAARLRAAGHDAVTPEDLGAHNLPDDVLVEVAAREGLVIVTENAADFGHVEHCAVLLVRKSWWPRTRLADGLASAVAAWAEAHPEPGTWVHWLGAGSR